MWGLDDKRSIIMTLLELKSKYLIDLELIYPKEEIFSFFFLLAQHELNMTRAEIALEPNKVILKKNESFFINALRQLKEEKPIQYIIGETEFYGLFFKVNKDVLIPRSETEELIDWILKEFNEKKELNILDIGTGSGCIAISLAKHLPEANIYGIDISKEALQIAEQNAKLNNVKVNFIQQDILKMDVMLSLSKNLSKSIQFDIIVGNPPYVRELEKLEIKNNVLQNEPHIALFVSDENPLLYYDKIADFAKQNLSSKGILFIEINQYLGKETINLLQQKRFKSIELRKDIFKNDRMIKASLI